MSSSMFLNASDVLTRYHTHNKYLPYPAKHITLRGAEEERYCVIDISRVGKPDGSPRILEEVEISRALFEIYEGGIVSLGYLMADECDSYYFVVHPSGPDIRGKAVHSYSEFSQYSSSRSKKLAMIPRWRE